MEVDDPLYRYFNVKDIEFDFIPETPGVPVVDVIADKIKGKTDVVLILGLGYGGENRVLQKLYTEVSPFNDFRRLRSGITLIIWFDLRKMVIGRNYVNVTY